MATEAAKGAEPKVALAVVLTIRAGVRGRRGM